MQELSILLQSFQVLEQAWRVSVVLDICAQILSCLTNEAVSKDCVYKFSFANTVRALSS